MLRANTSQGKTNSPWRSRLRSCQHRLGLLDRSCSVEACFGYPGHDSLHLIESSKGIGCHIPHALIGRLAGLVSFVHAFSQSLGKCEFVARPAPPPHRAQKRATPSQVGALSFSWPHNTSNLTTKHTKPLSHHQYF